MDNFTPIRPADQQAPPQRSMLTECLDETVHRVACVLKYLAAHPRDKDLADDPDEDFALFMIYRDMAAALEYAREVNHG